MGADCSGGAGGGRPAATALIEKRARWCDEAERGLARTFGHDREAIIAGVETGRFELWKINGGKMWMVTRVDRDVLTICCAQGAGLRELAPIWYEVARRNGLKAVEFFTRRPGLARLLRRWRFEPQETVYRCEVLPHEH